MEITKTDIGKLATFKTPYKYLCETTTRVIKAVMDDGSIRIQYYGCSDFIVPNIDVIEIKEIENG